MLFNSLDHFDLSNTGPRSVIVNLNDNAENGLDSSLLDKMMLKD